MPAARSRFLAVHSHSISTRPSQPVAYWRNRPPSPVLGALRQSRPHRVAMDVAQRLHELLVIADVAIVVALLPEGFAKCAHEPGQRPQPEAPQRDATKNF